MEELIRKMSEDIEKIKDHQLELIKLTAVHNHLLKEHEARSLALQESINLTKLEFEHKIEPIDEHVKFINNVAKAIAILGGTTSCLYYGYMLFSKLF